MGADFDRGGPVSVDFRTRADGPRQVVDPAACCAELAARFDDRGDLGPLLEWLRPRPLVLEVEGECWTLSADDDRVSCRAGHGFAGQDGLTDPARIAHVRLSVGELDDLVADQSTFMAMFSAGRLDQPAGSLPDLLDWSLLLRAAWDDQPIVLPADVDFLDRDGSPLDLSAARRLDDDPADLRHALETAGYLHLTGVYSEAEMAAVSAEMDVAATSYRPGDGRSWWARTAEGVDRLVRMQGFDRHSETTAELLDDPRLAAIGALPDVGHVNGRANDNRIEALFKPIGVVEGISDVPWHKDCSLGRHSYECCSLTVGISVTGADAGSGQLRVVAGSHRATCWPAFVRAGTGLPEVDLPTRTGDVTIHLSCTNHMAQPPVDRERRVLYTAFGLPQADPSAARAARDRLRRDREAAPLTVSQRPTTRT